MSARIKVLVVLTAAMFLAIAVGAASANHLSISSRNFRVVWNPIRFFGEGGIEAEVRCPLTLEGSFHSNTSAKVIGTLSGFVTREIIGRRETCTGGAATILTESLPRHLTYEGFTGTLPRITTIRTTYHGLRVLIEVGLGTSCLYEGDTGGIMGVEAGGGITGSTADNTRRVALLRGTFGCPSEGGFEGTGTVTLLGTTSRITVRLI